FISYAAPLAFGTVLAGVLAMIIAVPLAVAVALFITHIAPPRIAMTLGFLPIFEGPASITGRTMLVVGLVLAVMILPIVSAIAREAFSQTPRKLQEGAQALGATRWEMIRTTVLPFGKSSVISGSMLGLGRALG